MKPILQVEDDPNDVFFLQYAMRRVEVANPIQVASDGQQAIDYLKGINKFKDREKFPFPCLVLLDLKLPYVMGLNVLEWIRQQPGMGLIVILLTASGQDADIASAYRLGANAFLTKPSKASQLVDVAKAIKDFWLTHNTLPQESHGQAVAPFLTQMRKTPVKGRPVPRAVTLTSRQKEVVQLIAEGYATGEIAGLLSVSIKTVDKYRQQLMETLNGTRSRSITDSVVQKKNGKHTH